MSGLARYLWLPLVALAAALGCAHRPSDAEPRLHAGSHWQADDPFASLKAGDERRIALLRFCWCPPGQFVMGSPSDEPDRHDDEAQVEVRLTRGFWTGEYEVTQAQWQKVIGPFPLAQPPGEGGDFPVVEVNYSEAEVFCKRLTERSHRSGQLPGSWEFRLPTEAQWEYACRAGTTTATSVGNRLGGKQANFDGREPYNGGEPGPFVGRATRVGSYPANAWGIHDMHGNVYEWCRDWYLVRLPGGADPDLSNHKGTRNRDGTYSRVRRGGGWGDKGRFLRSAARMRYEPERRADHIGFRVVAVRL